MTRAPHGSRGRGRGRGSSSAASSGATNFIRDHQKLIFGAEFMLHRHHVDNRWVACEPRDEGHEPDSGVHRYDRVHGFAVTDDELEMMRRDPVIAAAERRSRQADKQDSHVQSVGRWAVFERYVLTFHRSEPYADFLRKCRRLALQTDMKELAGDPEQRLRMEAPPALLVLAYMQKLRFDDPNQAFPSRKHGSIRIMASAGISSILAEFSVGGAWPTKDARVVRQLKEWEDDGEESAVAFDMDVALPKLWAALWTLKGWSYGKRLMAWAMFLVGCCIMARASCITKHGPRIDGGDFKLPPARHWDTDGLPKYIILTLRKWKSREKKAGQYAPYPVKIHRNRVNPNYCPVTWLLIYMQYYEHTEGKLFQDVDTGGEPKDVTEAERIRMTNHWFVNAGLRTKGVPGDAEEGMPAQPPTGCSNHSIRRSAAQWAGRCNAKELEVRCAGRWKTMQILAKYMAQGAITRESYADDEDGSQEDPIFKMWVFKRVTSAAAGGVDIM